MNPVADILHALETHGLKDMSLLMIADDSSETLRLQTILGHAGFQSLHRVSDNGEREIVETIQELEPDLLLLDLTLSFLDSFALLTDLQVLLPDNHYLPILVFTNDERDGMKQRALAHGAHDFLKKPFENSEVILRVKNLLRTQLFYKQLKNSNARLEGLVAQRTKQLEQAHLEMLTRLARVAEYRDDKSGEHSWRVAHLSAQIAQELGQADDFIKLILRAARLHDVGKVAIPDKILMKPQRLTVQEFEIVKQHTIIGGQFLSNGRSALINMAETIALTHHERWDGTGYPKGLKGDAIPLEGRIVALADSFDALTRDRYHRQALSGQEAVHEIQKQSSQQFDPHVVRAFLQLYNRGKISGTEAINPSFTQW
ncbi:MAG: HD domain-containing phosphohydrolase [Trueperaceae bacterium]